MRTKVKNTNLLTRLNKAFTSYQHIFRLSLFLCFFLVFCCCFFLVCLAIVVVASIVAFRSSCHICYLDGIAQSLTWISYRYERYAEFKFILWPILEQWLALR